MTDEHAVNANGGNPLNPLDEAFDCAKALYTPLAQIQNALPSRRDVAIFKKAVPLNNISACASVSAAPFRMLGRSAPTPQPPVGTDAAVGAAKHKGGMKRTRDDEGSRSLAPRYGILRRMHARQAEQHGPLSFLVRAVTKRFRVRVRLRERHAVRGVVEGHVVAFDRHMNLVLLQAVIRDVGQDVRRSNQLFVRGENVVFISFC